MLKDAGYHEKIEILSLWLEEIIETVKRDLKNEHLKIDREFCRKYFLGKSPQSLTAQEMAPAYLQDIRQGNIGLAEFIASRWILKNTDIYGYFEAELRKINPDFESIEELKEEESRPLINSSLAEYGAKKTYIFSVFNSVVFCKNVYDSLKEQAEKESFEKNERSKQQVEEKTLADIKKRHERELHALTERFDKKIRGMEKKYLHDMEALKRQISALSLKIAGRSND